MERCWTYSHSPTPPACGQTGTPNFFAISKTAMTSFTPPSRQASIWQNETAFAWKSCLKRTRFWQCSPVATPTGATDFAIAAWPSTSSGLVGSSIQYGSNSARRFVDSIASSTSHTWFASSIRRRSGPISSRTIAALLASSSMSMPTLILTYPQPLVWCDRSRDVAEVHARNQRFRAHIREKLPEGLAFDLRVEVPDGVDD